MSNSLVIVLVVVGCILLAVANLTLWASRDVFNADRFGDHVAEGLQSDAASQALAEVAVQRVVENHPNFPPLARTPAEEIVTWLLQRPVFIPVFERSAAAAYTVMTTSAEDVIGIDMSAMISNVGPQIVGVVTAIDPEAGANIQAALDSAQESGPLVVYESGRFPRLRGLANAVPWIWPLTGLGAIALLGVTYWMAKSRRSELLAIGIGVLVVGLLTLLLIPALQAPVRNNISNPEMQIVVSQVLAEFTWGLAIQSLIVGLIGLALIVVSRFLPRAGAQA
ncbi:MAG: hypothetical protein GX552_14555 [Chloroflexi bacterium]|nr:hypothetical protein [Chloroflexota bacterium]